MLFIFPAPVLVRHLWQLNTVIFLSRCLIRAVLFEGKTSIQVFNVIKNYSNLTRMLKITIVYLPIFFQGLITMVIYHHIRYITIVFFTILHPRPNVIKLFMLVIYRVGEPCRGQTLQLISSLLQAQRKVKFMILAKFKNGSNKLECLFLASLSSIV